MGREALKITADTNVLVRALTEDHAEQSSSNRAWQSRASRAGNPHALRTGLGAESYQISAGDIAAAIRSLLNGVNVAVNRPAAEAGLTLLEAGGDFADGAIAYEGKWLGADTFVSFDKKAVAVIETNGGSARLQS
jgi:predicted nucleic-acid-binding protein